MMVAGGVWQLLLGTHLSTASKMGGVSNRGAQSTITYGTCIKCLDTEQLFNLRLKPHNHSRSAWQDSRHAPGMLVRGTMRLGVIPFRCHRPGIQIEEPGLKLGRNNH